MKDDYLISVIIPIYNAELYIYDSILSIVNQDYSNLEIILINDGSTDSSLNIIQKINDSRIKIFNNETNQGIVYSLNFGLKIAKGDFIARMDADDISNKNRLQEQLYYLLENQNIDLVGSHYKFMNNGFFYVLPLNHNDILNQMLISSPIAHPSVFFRRELIDKGDYQYNAEFQYCEDFELWSRLVFKYKFANLPDFLLEYRSHENQISQSRNEAQKRLTLVVRTNMLKILKSDLDNDFLLFGNYEVNFKQFENRFRKDFKTLDQLLVLNNQKMIYSLSFFSDYINGLKRNLVTHTLYKSKINNLFILFYFLLRNANVFKYITTGTFLKLCFQNFLLCNLYRK